MTSDSYPQLLLALCIWREARGQSREAKTAVKHVILNRVADPKGPYAHCKDVVSTILQPYQFSSFMVRDPNAARFPVPLNVGEWNEWQECCAVVDSTEPDPTGGATHYFSVDIQSPAWADPGKRTCVIGPFRFYKI